ncbi:hypothetical protein SAMN05216573_11259 [Bradyrhizobium sp. Rc3b]|nr:hypothetical protein SAMN05216573_11259 [Bradyrhizobium sp. Rc3b]
MDHGRDFKSNSVEEAARALRFGLRYMKPKKTLGYRLSNTGYGMAIRSSRSLH